MYNGEIQCPPHSIITRPATDFQCNFAVFRISGCKNKKLTIRSYFIECTVHYKQVRSISATGIWSAFACMIEAVKTNKH